MKNKGNNSCMASENKSCKVNVIELQNKNENEQRSKEMN